MYISVLRNFNEHHYQRKKMNWFFVLLIICFKLSENRIFVSTKPTDEPFATPPINDPTENSFSTSTPEMDTESEMSISTNPEVSDFSGTCPDSSCLNNFTEYRNEFPPSRGCYCGKLCAGLRDCCEDSIFYDQQEQRKPRTLDCDHNLLYEPNGYYVDRGCSRSWKDLEFAEKCALSKTLSLDTADLKLVVPVTSLSTGVTYGNIFCAICNYEDNFIVWDIKIINCVADEPIITSTETTHDGDTFVTENYELRERVIKPKNSSDLKFNGKQWYVVENETEYICQLILNSPENVKLNICAPNEAFKSLAINSCSENWTDSTVSSQCQGASYALVYQNIPNTYSKTYKNKFCAYCNGLNDSQLVCFPSMITVIMGVYDVFGGRSLSVTFDFNIDLSNTEFCHKVSTKGENMTASEKRFCPTNAEQTELLEKTSNWFFTLYTSLALLVSLILLICHLLVFTLVKKLHTIGGKNLASFCLALILAYCNFLAGNYLEGNACFVVSIVTYYSFLSAFSWMFTISFDIWKTFRDLTKKLKGPQNSKYKFLLYSICSWTIPAFVVSIAVYLDLSKSHPALAPHFGENGCWFHNGYSLLLFFVVPVSIIILINFVLFLYVSLILRSNQCASANQKAYVDYKLFARIGLLTGFTWITGFIAGYFQSISIWYIFVILNTGQGFLIFLCFTCKKKIIAIALQRIGLSCCLTESCKKLGYSTVTTSVKTETESVTLTEKNSESELIKK